MHAPLFNTAALGAALAIAVAVAGCGSSPAPQPDQVHAAASSRQAATRGTAVHRGPRHGAVPILMYHVVNAPPPGTPYPQLWVPAAEFAAQMHALAAAGYRGVTLDAVLANWRRGTALPSRPVVVSFDDGYRSQERDAMPVLSALGWPGVLNLEVHNLHVAGGLGPNRVRRLIAAGWEVDAHTLTHPDLTTVDAARLKREIAGSRQAIRATFGVAADAFCYPSGRFDATVEAAVRAAGYRAATTTQPGAARRTGDRYALNRIRVNGDEGAQAVLAAVHAAR